MECVTIGQLNSDGPCTLFQKVNDNGIVLFECGDVGYTPANCPDDPAEGTFAVGPAVVKIASVDGTVPDVLVQRDFEGTAFAKKFQVNGDDCTEEEYASRLSPFDVSVGDGTATLIPGSSYLHLRGFGDTPAFGGGQALNNVGYFEIQRLGGKNTPVLYTNIGSDPVVGNVGGHIWAIATLDPGATQGLMELQSTGGTLYFPAWMYVSDIRLKANVAALDGKEALKVVTGLTPISYQMHGNPYHGFSAQDVQTVLPHAVTESPDRNVPMTMRDGDILANLVAAVKFLTARVEALEAKAGV